MKFSEFRTRVLNSSGQSTPEFRKVHRAINEAFTPDQLNITNGTSSSLGEVISYRYDLGQKAVNLVFGNRGGRYDVQGVQVWENYAPDTDPSFTADLGGLPAASLIEAIIDLIERPRDGMIEVQVPMTEQELSEMTWRELGGHWKDMASITKSKFKDAANPQKRTKAGVRHNADASAHFAHAMKHHDQVKHITVNHKTNTVGVRYKDGSSWEHSHEHKPHNIDVIQRFANHMSRKGAKINVYGKYQRPEANEEIEWTPGTALFEGIDPPAMTKRVSIRSHRGLGTLGRVDAVR